MLTLTSRKWPRVTQYENRLTWPFNSRLLSEPPTTKRIGFAIFKNTCLVSFHLAYPEATALAIFWTCKYVHSRYIELWACLGVTEGASTVVPFDFLSLYWIITAARHCVTQHHHLLSGSRRLLESQCPPLAYNGKNLVCRWPLLCT